MTCVLLGGVQLHDAVVVVSRVYQSSGKRRINLSANSDDRPTTARYLLYEMAQGSERTGSSVILARLCCKSKMSDTSQKSCLFLSLSLSGRLISDSVRLFSPYFWPSACCFTLHRHSVSAVLIIMDSLLFLLSSPPPLAYI
jgi:hypothetical protein